MKHLKQLLILALLAIIGTGQMWGATVKDTIAIVGFAGSTSTSYVTTEATGATNKGVAAIMNNWTPAGSNKGQIRVNQGNNTTGTTTTNASNFYVYNSGVMPGNITKIEMEISSGTTTAAYCRLATSTSSAVTSNVAYNSTTASSLSSSIHSWTLSKDDGIKYFRIEWTKNGGTIKASYVIITYETSGGSGKQDLFFDPHST